MRSLLVALVFGLGACHQDTGFMERSFACADSADCIAGYACHPGLRVCVEEDTIVQEDVTTDRLPVNAAGMMFLVDRTEVRVRDYTQCVLRGICEAPNCTSFDLDSPAHCLTWADARDFCAWTGGRLPTAEEWTLAAVGGTGQIFPWGESAASCVLAILDDGGAGCGAQRAATVGSRPDGASPFGMLDMVGNVWEWVADERPDALRVTKGGSFVDPGDLEVIQPSSLNPIVHAPRFTDPSVGFRCIESL